MAANTNPIFTRVGDIGMAGAVLGATAVTNLDGTGALSPIYQADTTEGSYVTRIIAKPVSSANATVVRIYICSVTGAFTSGTSNTVANTDLIAEQTLPANTVSATAASPQFEIPINIALPIGFRLLASFGTSTGGAGTGYKLTTIAAKY